MACPKRRSTPAKVAGDRRPQLHYTSPSEPSRRGLVGAAFDRRTRQAANRLSAVVGYSTAEFCRVLGHPARLRILELLRERERNVSELQLELGIEASLVSQQLAVLRAKHILDTRRAGTSVYYTVRDPQVFQLLDVAREIFNNHLIDLQAMLATESPPAIDAQVGARPPCP